MINNEEVSSRDKFYTSNSDSKIARDFYLRKTVNEFFIIDNEKVSSRDQFYTNNLNSKIVENFYLKSYL
jgi:hypothetical protein